MKISKKNENGYTQISKGKRCILTLIENICMDEVVIMKAIIIPNNEKCCKTITLYARVVSTILNNAHKKCQENDVPTRKFQ